MAVQAFVQRLGVAQSRNLTVKAGDLGSRGG